MVSRHAEVRCAQRGIRTDIVETILDYGTRAHRHHAEVCYIDKTARRRIVRDLGLDAYRRIADRLDTYLVVADDGRIITAAKRLRRIRI